MYSIHHLQYGSSSYEYQKNISLKDIQNDISFSMQKNGGQGGLTLSLANQPIQYSYKYYDLIEVYSKKTPLYRGYINDISEEYDNDFILVLDCVGIGSDLTQKLYEDTGLLTFTKNDTIQNQLNRIIDNYNTKTRYTLTKSIIATSGNVNVEYKEDTHQKAIEKVTDFATGTYRFIGADGSFVYDNDGAIEHILTYRKDVQSINVDVESDIVNRLILTYKTGTKTYNDTASQALYGIHEETQSDTSIQDETSADDFADRFFSEQSTPIEKTSIVVNYLFKSQVPNVRDDTDVRDDTLTRSDFVLTGGLEALKPGHKVSVAGLPRKIEGIIDNIEYNNDTVTIELNKKETFISLINNGNTNS